jgi:hypothetical protein
MKRLFLGITLAACLLSFQSFANEGAVPDVLQSFYKTFHNAQNVNWTKVDDMLRIGFTMNGHQQFAYYSNDDLVVLATQIKTEELPEALKTQLSEYKGNVTEVYELNKGKSIEYCVMLESATKHIILKGKNRWKVYVDEKI